MNTKVTLIKALEEIINNTKHLQDSTLIYITFDYNRGFGATATDVELSYPEHLYFTNLGACRENGGRFQKMLKRINSIDDQVVEEQR